MRIISERADPARKAFGMITPRSIPISCPRMTSENVTISPAFGVLYDALSTVLFLLGVSCTKSHLKTMKIRIKSA